MGGERRGYDGGKKKVHGRKRHLLVDTEGLVLKAKIHSARVHDEDGIKAAAAAGVRADRAFAPQAPVGGRWLPAGPRQKVGRGGSRAERREVVRKPPKPVPKKVAKVWAEEWAKEGKRRWTGKG